MVKASSSKECSLRRKKGFRDKRQKKQIQEHMLKIEEAYKEIRLSGEKATVTRIMERTSLSKPTVIKYMKKIVAKEKKHLQENEKSDDVKRCYSSFLGRDIRTFIRERDSKTREISERWEKMPTIKKMFNLKLQDRMTTRELLFQHFYERRVNQLKCSLDIKYRTKQKEEFFEKEFQNQLKTPIIDFFYSYLFDTGIFRSPENFLGSKCSITITFDPFEGTMKFLESQIDGNEQRLVHGLWISDPIHGEDFEEILSHLMANHIELYRLIAIQNGTFSNDDFEDFQKNIFKYTKTRVLQRLDEEKDSHFLNPLLPHKISRPSGKVNKGRLKELFDIYAEGEKAYLQTLEKT